MQQAIVFAAVVSFLLQCSLSDAFVVFSVQSTRSAAPVLSLYRSSMTRLFNHGAAFSGGGDLADDDNDDEDDGLDDLQNFFDVDAARRQLEALVAGGGGVGGGGSGAPSGSEPPSPPSREMKLPGRPVGTVASLRSPPSSSSPLSAVERPVLDVDMPPAPVMTSIARERRLAEIRLLDELVDGDETLADMWSLWFAERGPKARKLLQTADDLINDGPADWKRAEKILRGLIKEHGMFFVEPVNRLATLCYLQNRFDEALMLNKIVLAVKPWHFGALSGIVMTYAALDDTDSARQWAALRLPKYNPTGLNRRRKQWVERALNDAFVTLEEGNERARDMFGPPDRHHTDDIQVDEDSWQ